MKTITFCDLRFHLQHIIINVTNKVTKIMNPTDAQVVKLIHLGMTSFLWVQFRLQCDGRRRISFSIVWFTRYISSPSFNTLSTINYRNVYATGDIYCILMNIDSLILEGRIIGCVIFLGHQFFWSHPRVWIMIPHLKFLTFCSACILITPVDRLLSSEQYTNLDDKRCCVSTLFDKCCKVVHETLCPSFRHNGVNETGLPPDHTFEGQSAL